MPSQILHILFGEDVINGVYQRIVPGFGLVADKALEKIQCAYKTAFALGCQGPDIFYHSRNRRPVGLEYGTLLHRRGAGIFTAGLLKLSLPDPPPSEEDLRAGRREMGINALGTYALGFMTHAILDRQAHPYIVYRSGDFSADRGETLSNARFHVFFERILDVLMLRELREEEIHTWDQEGILAGVCERPPLGLQELLARALILAFPERAGKDGKLILRMQNTFSDCTEFYHRTAPRMTSTVKPFISEQHFLYQSDPESLPYIYPENISRSDNGEGPDFLNLKSSPWHYPLIGSKEDHRSFPELYADAVSIAVESISPVIVRYLDTGIFPITEAARVIGNGGLSVVDDNGKPCSPELSDPLPLDKVLEEQGRMRGFI